MGKGDLTVRSASGRTAVLSHNAAATINATTATSSTGAIAMADDSTLRGMIVNQMQNPVNADPYGVLVDNRSNVTIIDNTISVLSTNGSAFGTFVSDSSNVTICGNTISASRPGVVAIGLYVNNSSVTIADNSLGQAAIPPLVLISLPIPGEHLRFCPAPRGTSLRPGPAEG